jgi:hypothetical protein
MKWSIVLASLLLLLHVTLYAFVNRSFLPLIGNLFQEFALLCVAIVFTRYSSRSTKEETTIRNLLTLGFWIWVVSQALLSYSELLLKQAATGSVTDAIWLIGYLFIIRALYLLLQRHIQKPRARVQVLVQIFVVLVIVCASLWEIIFDPNVTVMIRFLQVIFPFLDLMIAGLAFQVARESRESKWMIGAIASLIIGITDLIYPYFDDLSSPMFRYLDIPLFVGYSVWYLQAIALVRTEGKVFSSEGKSQIM